MKALVLQLPIDDDMKTMEVGDVRIPVYLPSGVTGSTDLVMRANRTYNLPQATKVTALRGKARIIVGGTDMGTSYTFPVRSTSGTDLFSIRTTEDDVIKIENYFCASWSNIVGRTTATAPMGIIYIPEIFKAIDPTTTTTFALSATPGLYAKHIYGEVPPLDGYVLSVLELENPSIVTAAISDLSKGNLTTITINSPNVEGNIGDGLFQKCTYLILNETEKITYKNNGASQTNLTILRVISIPKSDLGDDLGVLIADINTMASTKITSLKLKGDLSSVNMAHVTAIKTRNPTLVFEINGVVV